MAEWTSPSKEWGGTESYDFLQFVSLPSALRLETARPPEAFSWKRLKNFLPVTPGATLRIITHMKIENAVDSHIAFEVYDREGKILRRLPDVPEGRSGSFDWTEFRGTTPVPSDAYYVIPILNAGTKGPAGSKGITWLDDLKIIQDDVLIFSDDFSNWNPCIGAGVGASIGGVAGYLLREPLDPMVSEAVGAVLGGALGGGVGLLTGLGIIPVPQIPTLGATPGESVAPARLGKYLVTG